MLFVFGTSVLCYVPSNMFSNCDCFSIWILKLMIKTSSYDEKATIIWKVEAFKTKVVEFILSLTKYKNFCITRIFRSSF